MATPLLNLTTLTECPTVVIDGQAYALTPVDALDLVSLFKLDAMRQRINDLHLKQKVHDGALTPDEQTAAEQVFDELVAIVLQAPPDVHDKLSTLQKMAIGQSFFALPQTIALTAAAMTGASRPTGASSSRGFPGSTPAARSSGSRGRRSRSSGRVS